MQMTSTETTPQPATSGTGNVRGLFRNSGYLLIGILLANMSVFLTNTFLARTLPKTEYGTLILVHYIINIVVLIMNFGIPEGVTTFIAGYTDNKDQTKTVSAISAAVKLTLAACILFTVLLLLLSGGIAGQFSSPGVTSLIRLTALWIFPFFISVLGGSVIEGFQQMKYSFAVRNLFEPLKFVIIIVLFFTSALTVRNIYRSWTAGYLAYGLAILVFMSIFLSSNRIGLRWKYDGHEIRWFKKFLPYYIPFIAPLLINMVVPVLIVRIHSTVAVADFSVVMPLISLTPVLFSAVSRALLPAISHRYRRDKALMDSLNLSLFRILGLLNCLIYFVIVYNNQIIIKLLFGARYLSSGTILTVLMLAAFFENFKFILDPLLKGTRYVHVVLRLDYMRLLLLVAIGYVLISKYGGLGAAVTLCIINIPALVMKLWFVRSRLQLNLFPVFTKEVIFIAAISLSSYYGIPMYTALLILAALFAATRIISRRELRRLFRRPAGQGN